MRARRVGFHADPIVYDASKLTSARMGHAAGSSLYAMPAELALLHDLCCQQCWSSPQDLFSALCVCYIVRQVRNSTQLACKPNCHVYMPTGCGLCIACHNLALRKRSGHRMGSTPVAVDAAHDALRVLVLEALLSGLQWHCDTIDSMHEAWRGLHTACTALVMSSMPCQAHHRRPPWTAAPPAASK